MNETLLRVIRAIVAKVGGFDNALPVSGWMECITYFSPAGVDPAKSELIERGAHPSLVRAAFCEMSPSAALLEAGFVLENDNIRMRHNGHAVVSENKQ